jgi:broad specificity phosphatase PhoE
MELWFETHATSADNELRVASGQRDSPLSPRGRSEAAQLGGRYAGRDLRAIHTSDLTRAIDTARIAFPATPRFSDPRLRECDYGEWTGCPLDRLDSARTSFVERPFPGGESFRDVVRRVGPFLATLVAEPALVIGHRAIWYALEHLLVGRDLTGVVGTPWQWQPGWRYTL